MRLRLPCIFGCGLVLAASAAASPSANIAGTIVFSADRAPTLDNEVYLVGADGTQRDLSRSIAKDVGPAVSPNGKLVAFASNRGGAIAIYTVHIDGTHLRRVSSTLYRGINAAQIGAQIAWSPDSARIAAVVSGYALASAVWFGDVAGHGRVVAKTVGAQDPSVSGNGEVAYAEADPGYEVHVVSAAGKHLWTATWASQIAPAWSRSNRFAVQSQGDVSVYDAAGRKLDAFPGVTFAWSPNGRELASIYERHLAVRTGGVGKPVVDAPIGQSQQIQWMSNGTLRVERAGDWVGYDVAHDTPLQLASGYSTWTFPSIVSATGGLAYGTQEPLDTPETLYLDGASVASAMPCGDDTPFGSLQFVPREQAVVYDGTDCVPSADIYSVSGDGTGLRQITKTINDETAPSVAPDGSEIAFVHMFVAEQCQGCPTTIWTAGGDGSNIQERTPAIQDFFDDSPSFSPDGKTIVFSHSPIEGTSQLIEIPESGGDEKVLPVNGFDPSWGPTRIAYTTSGAYIRTVLPDGTDVQTVALDKHIENETLAWSRDGRLAYIDVSMNDALTLVIVGKRYPLPGLRNTFFGLGVAWSRDGKKLAFTASDAMGVSDIWTIDADGTHMTRLTHGLGAGGRLSWIP